MTAIPRRRRRRTVTGFLIGMLLTVAAMILFVAGVVTLSNSEEGEAVGQDDRLVVALPDTPNALLAVTGSRGDLASVIVMTLLPQGQGGSIVTIPVNADATGGFGAERQPLNEIFDADDVETIVGPLEEILTITIQRAQVVDEAGLVDLLGPVETLQVDLPEDVIDSATFASAIIAEAGSQSLRRLVVAQSLAAVDDEGQSYDHHDIDVELWSALSRTAPVKVPPEPVETDEFGLPVPPETVADLMERLWEGNIEVRDVQVTETSDGAASDDAGVPSESSESSDTGAATDAPGSAVTDSSDDPDVVLVDRSDAILIFAQVSPALVSSPNLAMSFRIEAGFDDEQLASTDGLYETSSELVREMINELLFLQTNVISVDTAQRTEGAPVVTRIAVADERFVEDMELAGPIFFGETVVEVSDVVLDGVDAVVTLGTSYLDLRAKIVSDLAEDAIDDTVDDGPGETIGDTVGTDD